MIMAGQLPKHAPSKAIIQAISGQTQPILCSGQSTYETMLSISNYTAKLNPLDVNRTIAAIDHYEDYIDFERILE